MSWAAAVAGSVAVTGMVVDHFGNKKKDKAAKKSVIDAYKRSGEILGKFDARTDESGVRGEMSKYSRLADIFNTEGSRSYLDTTEGKSFSSMIDKASVKKRDRLRQDASMMGMSSESYLAGLNNINEQEGSSMNQLVAGADSRRMNLRSQQMQALSQVLGGEQGLFNASQSRFGQSYGIGGQIAQNAANAQAVSNQNAMNQIGALGNAVTQFAGAGGFQKGKGANAPSSQGYEGGGGGALQYGR